jgi:hypothetical protein
MSKIKHSLLVSSIDVARLPRKEYFRKIAQQASTMSGILIQNIFSTEQVTVHMHTLPSNKTDSRLSHLTPISDRPSKNRA